MVTNAKLISKVYGRLGCACLIANTPTVVYRVPLAIQFATIHFNIVNGSTEPAKIRVAISLSEVALNSEYIEYDVELKPGAVLERTSMNCSSGERVIFTSDKPNTSVRVHGFEEVLYG